MCFLSDSQSGFTIVSPVISSAYASPLVWNIKLHAGLLHHENAQMTVHEVFVHPFRLPRRGEEMAHFLFLLCFCIAKSPCSPKGTRTENTISAVPPCLPVNRPLDRRQHAACPVTLAMRQKILKPTLFPSALGGPFAAPLLASLSAVGNSLWMRLQLYFRVCGLLF